MHEGRSHQANGAPPPPGFFAAAPGFGEPPPPTYYAHHYRQPPHQPPQSTGSQMFAFARAVLHDILNARQVRAAARHEEQRRRATALRLALLNPNEDSDIKIEKYVFSLTPKQFARGEDLRWGEGNGWTAFKNPQVPFRAENLAINVPCPGLVYVMNIQAANVNGQIGADADGYTFAAPHGKDISLPTLPPQNTMQMSGTWTTFVPASRRVSNRAAERDRRGRRAALAQKQTVIAQLLDGARGARKKELLADLEDVRAELTKLAEPMPALPAEKFMLTLDFTGWATVIA